MCLLARLISLGACPPCRREPLRFHSERFLERKFTPFEFVPFGGGARRCLGATMAAYEMRLLLGTILRRYRLRLASLRPDPGKVRAANAGPAHGVRMIVEERLAANRQPRC
ncbi:MULTISPECIES: cytochrome P450 [Sorangium]|uniref:cytochrome P450 n=1 Tax=Sorangium TaxID=39643 RepID=UPI003D9C0BB9